MVLPDVIKFSGTKAHEFIFMSPSLNAMSYIYNVTQYAVNATDVQ